jgi:protein phosphatase
MKCTTCGAVLAVFGGSKPLFATSLLSSTPAILAVLAVVAAAGFTTWKFFQRKRAQTKSSATKSGTTVDFQQSKSGTANKSKVNLADTVDFVLGDPSTIDAGELRLEAFGATHIGGRESNEDAFLLKGETFIVADGMGGQARGEEASAALIAAFNDVQLEGADWFVRGVNLATERMRVLVAEDAQRQGLGTTVVAARRVEPTTMEVGWSGDSHFFRLRDGVFQRLTVEHSLAVALWRAGSITEAEISTHRFRNVLHKYVGATVGAPEWEALRFEIKPGDRYLVCSDGLVDYSDLTQVQKILAGPGSPQARAEALIALAVADQTKDNATAIVIDVLS